MRRLGANMSFCSRLRAGESKEQRRGGIGDSGGGWGGGGGGKGGTQVGVNFLDCEQERREAIRR